MSRVLMIAGVAAVCAAAACAHTSHYQANAFAWSGSVPAGQWVHVRNLHGTISVVPSSGPNVEVHASKRWTRGGDEVHFALNRADDGITVCAMNRAGNSCSPNHYSSGEHGSMFSFARHTDARVDFVVNVPAGVNLDLGSIDGSVRASGTSGTVDVKVVKGDIDIASHQGALDLITVNGSVTAALDTLPATGDISMKSVNGSITAVLPPKLDGTVSFETVTGHISNGFQLTTDAPASSKHLTGTVGSGGSRHVDLTTVNGSVTLLKHA
jgi:opacity protein-like surface antigen